MVGVHHAVAFAVLAATFGAAAVGAWTYYRRREPRGVLLPHQPVPARTSDPRGDRRGDRGPRPRADAGGARAPRAHRVRARDRVFHLPHLARAAGGDLAVAAACTVGLLRRGGRGGRGR